MRPHFLFLLLIPVLVAAGGCTATGTVGMRAPDGRAIGAVDPGPWHASPSAAALGPVGQGDVRAAFWWESDPAWRRFLLNPPASSAQAGR